MSAESLSEAHRMLSKAIGLDFALRERAAATGLVEYHKQLIIDSRPIPKAFIDAADQWQWDRVYRVEKRVELLTGHQYLTNRIGEPPRAYWDVCPRGHDKSTGVGRVLAFMLAYSRNQLNMYAAAGDEEQANLLSEAMQAEINLNPWLKERIEFKNKLVTGPGGRLRILTSDAPTSWGSRPDVVVLDELTFWKKRALFDALVTGLHKRPGSMLWIIGNAGELDTWQWDLLQVAKSDPSFWSVFEVPVDTTLASWLSGDDITRIVKTLPPGLARRVIWNHWVPQGEGCDYLQTAEITPCVVEDLPVDLEPVDGRLYFISLDYGPKKDRTVGTVLHRDDTTLKVTIDRMRIWQGSQAVPVPIGLPGPNEDPAADSVCEWLWSMKATYPYCIFVMDEYQMEAVIQKLRSEGATVIRFEPRGGKSNYEMAEALRDHIINRRISWRPGTGDLVVAGGDSLSRVETLADELSRLVVKPTPYGYRFDHTLAFHDDRACSIGMGLVKCISEALYPSHQVPRPGPVKAREPIIPTLSTFGNLSNTRGMFGLQ